MIKRIISLLVLFLYLHGMSGYTMSFHTCTVTGSENVYTSYGLEDPCNEEETDCTETTTHFEEADCCDIQQTIVSVDEDTDITPYKINFSAPVITTSFVQYYSLQSTRFVSHVNTQDSPVWPPEPSRICVFRI